MKRNKKKCNILILCLLLCSMLGGCTKKIDTRVWINVISDMEPAYARELLDQYYSTNKDVVINIINKPALEAKNIIENKEGDYDIWLGNLYEDTVELADKGYFAEYKPKGYENLLSNYQDMNEVPKYIVIAAETSKVVANDSLKKEIKNNGLVETVINNIDDFAIMNPEKTVQGLLFLEDIYDKYGEKDSEYIYRKLKQSKKSYTLKNYESGRKVDRNLLKGAVVADYTAYYSEVDDYETHRYDVIDNPNYNFVSAAIINNNGARKRQFEAAKKFMDFLTSKEALQYVNKYKMVITNKFPLQINDETLGSGRVFTVEHKREKYEQILKIYKKA